MSTLIAAIVTGLCLTASAQQPGVFPTAEWTRTTPQAAGWNLDRMARVNAYVTKGEVHKREVARLVRLVVEAADH